MFRRRPPVPKARRSGGSSVSGPKPRGQAPQTAAPHTARTTDPHGPRSWLLTPGSHRHRNPSAGTPVPVNDDD
ncbi:unnamed protein product [Arctogadus glacialis]